MTELHWQICRLPCCVTYDEHYAGSPNAGSSLLFMDGRSNKATLKDVPASKPLGSSLYRIDCDDTGKVISNPSTTMQAVRNIVSEKGLKPTWLDREKQYYVEYANGENTSKIWIEDSRSISNRLNLISKYNLAGSACWQLSQAEDSIWEVFDGMLKKNKPMSNYNNSY